MKKILLSFCAAIAALAPEVAAEVPDSVYVYLYTNVDENVRDGLHWAWSADGERWQSPSPWQSLVSSDYGTWGAEKRMHAPFAMRDARGTWHVVWSVNRRDATFAHAVSDNLIDWLPQQYPPVGVRSCIDPEVALDARSGQYLVSWLDIDADGDTACMASLTPDFGSYSAARTVPGSVRSGARTRIAALGQKAEGTVGRISRRELRALIDHAEAEAARNTRYSEDAGADAVRFAGLDTVRATIALDVAPARPMSPMLMGVFFEDISRAADGGLYAELVQNRDFEYTPADRGGSHPDWCATHSWVTEGSAQMRIDTIAPVHANNPHYARLRTGAAGGALLNAGFEGMALKGGERYDFAMFARSVEGKRAVGVSLVAPDGTELASAVVSAPRGKWGRVKAVLVPKAGCDSARLCVAPAAGSEIDVDMVSLFPRSTFRGRRNGLRRDLADTIAALRPRFVRFPGGCVAHGNGLDNIYRWKNTIGPLEARVPQPNLWGYHQTAGLGYHEYFEFCEDLGAEPVPVVAAGVPCQNSWHGGAGQQGGIPMGEMDAYVQDVLDLVEYANGNARTTRWGRERARNGHPEPFGLKYLGVGNEDLISDVFEERFRMIFNAVRERYPEITVIGTAGPFHSGSDYDEGWRLAAELGVPVVDEHYYEAPAWFIYNQDYYDGYDRSRGKVYLGEYASRGNRLYNALAEAAYLCGVERNADVVAMTSYAPLLAKEGQTNWNPDLIYFTNTEVRPTVNYRVQRLFGENAGAEYRPSALTVDTSDRAVRARVAASVTADADGASIVKLVNILPAPVSIKGIPVAGDAEITTLTGCADSRSDYSLAARRQAVEGSVVLPPYSFVIIRYDR